MRKTKQLALSPSLCLCTCSTHMFEAKSYQNKYLWGAGSSAIVTRCLLTFTVNGWDKDIVFLASEWPTDLMSHVQNDYSVNHSWVFSLWIYRYENMYDGDKNVMKTASQMLTVFVKNARVILLKVLNFFNFFILFKWRTLHLDCEKLIEGMAKYF